MSKLEVRVDSWVEKRLLESGVKYGKENDLTDKHKRALDGGSKTASGKGRGRPDFVVIPTYIDENGKEKTNDRLAIVIENKWGINKFENLGKTGQYLKTQKSIADFAVNGVLHYAQTMMESEEYDEVIAIAVAGEGEVEDMTTYTKLFYFYDKNEEPKLIKENFDHFMFFNKEKFKDFYYDIRLTEEEKHRVLIKSYEELKKTSRELNKLMNDNAILVDQRVVYVSGMLLAMNNGLTPGELKGHSPHDTKRSDGHLIYNHIEEFLTMRKVESAKVDMMLSVFNTIKIDTDRDIPRPYNSKLNGREKWGLEDEITLNKELFVFIYENVFVKISGKSHIDTLGEMYSEFLKYALGDGKENGIVLTPPYVTQMMNKIIEVDRNSHVLDSCTGSAGFLVASMTEMIQDAKEHYKYEDPKVLEEKIENIKKHQMLGIELDLKMYTLATTNMILRGDGSSTILKDNAFDVLKDPNGTARIFKANKALLNPPFSYAENGMPFALSALNVMEKGGLLAIIIQDSAGTGRAIKTNKLILRDHTLVASIRMPVDLFQPNAGVQTSIYVIEAGIPHDYRKQVKFIDFSDDGYKRTGRGIRETGNPSQKYQDILDVYVSGVSKGGIDCILDTITDSGDDWNYTQHQVFDTTPTEEDFIKTVGDYLQFEISQLLQTQ